MPAEGRDPAVKVLTVLNCMAESDTEWGVRELAKRLDLTPSSCLRALQVLRDNGYVHQDEVTKRFDLSGASLRLAHHIIRRHSLGNEIRPVLDAVTEETGEAALLALVDWSRPEMMFVAASEPTHPLRYIVRLHEWGPLTTGASGLAALPFGPEGAFEHALEAVPEPERAEVLAQLQQVREQGFVFTRGRRISGAVGIAAPVLGPDGFARGTITISLPESRFDEDRLGALAEVVIGAARNATSIAGGPGTT